MDIDDFKRNTLPRIARTWHKIAFKGAGDFKAKLKRGPSGMEVANGHDGDSCSEQIGEFEIYTTRGKFFHTHARSEEVQDGNWIWLMIMERVKRDE